MKRLSTIAAVLAALACTPVHAQTETWTQICRGAILLNSVDDYAEVYHGGELNCLFLPDSDIGRKILAKCRNGERCEFRAVVTSHYRVMRIIGEVRGWRGKVLDGCIADREQC